MGTSWCRKVVSDKRTGDGLRTGWYWRVVSVYDTGDGLVASWCWRVVCDWVLGMVWAQAGVGG